MSPDVKKLESINELIDSNIKQQDIISIDDDSLVVIEDSTDSIQFFKYDTMCWQLSNTSTAGDIQPLNLFIQMGVFWSEPVTIHPQMTSL